MGKQKKQFGGNSHQRSMARTRGNESQRPPLAAPISPEKTKTMLEIIFSWPVVSALALLLIASGVGVLSMTPPETKIAVVLFSIGFPLLLIKLCVWIAFERSESFPEKVIFVGLACAASGISWYSCVALANSKVLHIEESQLRFECFATNIGYQQNTVVAGVKWDKSFAEVRLNIQSIRKLPMLNVDIKYQATRAGEDFMGIEQISDVSGVGFHRPPSPELPDGLRLKGGDGSVGNPIPMMNELMAKAIPWSHSYRVTCPRLESGEKISIKSIMTNDNSPGVAPNGLQIDGSYETPASEGNVQRVTFSQSCKITRP